MATWISLRASSRAIAAPSPREAPVMSAVRGVGDGDIGEEFIRCSSVWVCRCAHRLGSDDSLKRPRSGEWYDFAGRETMPGSQAKVPTEAIELYNDFIHGEISRRAF